MRYRFSNILDECTASIFRLEEEAMPETSKELVIGRVNHI
jgi:hypothetical protein